MAAKKFALVLHPVRFVTDVRQRVAEVEIAPIIRRPALRDARQIDEHVAEKLVGAHRVVIARRIFIASPQTVFVHHDPFAREAAGDQPAQASVANRQGFIHEMGCRAAAQMEARLAGTGGQRLGPGAFRRLLIPQHLIAGGTLPGQPNDRQETNECAFHNSMNWETAFLPVDQTNTQHVATLIDFVTFIDGGDSTPRRAARVLA